MYSRYAFDESPGNAIHATGTAFGIGAGAMVALAPFISLDVGAHYYFRYTFGNAQDDSGAEQPNSGATGAAFQLRAALSIGLGGP